MIAGRIEFYFPMMLTIFTLGTDFFLIRGLIFLLHFNTFKEQNTIIIKLSGHRTEFIKKAVINVPLKS